MWADNPHLLGQGIWDATLDGGLFNHVFISVLYGNLVPYGLGLASIPLFFAGFVISGYIAWLLTKDYPEEDEVWTVRMAFRSTHPLTGAVLHACYLPIALVLAILLVRPGPAAYWIALIVLTAGFTVALAMFRCFGWETDEKQAIERHLRSSGY